MLQVLQETDAIKYITPELHAILNKDEAHIKQTIDRAAQLEFPLAVRWAVMLLSCQNTALAIQLCERLKVPTEVRDVAVLALREHKKIECALALSPQEVVHLLERCDAFRRPSRFTNILQAALYGTDSTHDTNTVTDFIYRTQSYLEEALICARDIPSGSIAESTRLHFPNQPQQIALAISAARTAAVTQIKKTHGF